MAHPPLKDLKIAPLGVLLVAESEQYSCHLQYDSLADVLKAHGAKLQTVPNSATDIVILGSTAREKDFETSKKAAGLEKERDLGMTGERKKPLAVLSFHEFALRYHLEGAFIDAATTVDYGVPPAKPPGLARTRGTMLPRTLVSNSGAGVAKGLCSVFIHNQSLYWPEE